MGVFPAKGDVGSGGYVGQIDLSALSELVVRLKDIRIDVLRLAFCDLMGVERSRDILVSSMVSVLSNGVPFSSEIYRRTDGAATGQSRIEAVKTAGDILGYLDIGTLKAVPWEAGVAHGILDLQNLDGTAVAEDPREVLRRVQGKLTAMGLVPLVGPELEFYLLEPDGNSGWQRYGLGGGNIYSSGLKGDPENFLLNSLRMLEGFEIGAFGANHEFSSGQFEINLWHCIATEAADRAFRFKSAIKEMGRQTNKLATFMAKPFNGESGSGFHLHFSILDDLGRPLFEDKGGPDGLSDLARSAIAGVLRHARAVTALCSPTINSYKRFAPGTFAPWLVDWGLNDRGAMIRIPSQRGLSTRMELRLGDASANPYLAIAGLLAGAYLGIKEELTLPEVRTGDPRDLIALPRTLRDAIEALRDDEELVELLGDGFVDAFICLKRDEIERFSRYVTDWEFIEYAYHL
ncbi:glutamine synthetase family protein [Acidithrix sp. C25]|uniref:glutamine synthetase family protein n=1 Tax=Acidithrix sp. C25 TaxID=1671482 RepID=UPI00191B9E9E|nr:glutamine synthetase family protein [Acidithrix sp. C25]